MILLCGMAGMVRDLKVWLLASIVCLLMCFSAVAQDDRQVVLKSGHGYLVVDLRLEQNVSEITFARPGRDVPVLTLGPFEKGRHLVLVQVKKGRLRLNTVSAPSFNLPFRTDYDGLKRTSMVIEPRKTNYFAQIVVGKNRSTRGYDIDILNRLAYSYNELEIKYGDTIAQYPIVCAGYIRDFFCDEYLSGGAKSNE